jgi:Fuseless
MTLNLDDDDGIASNKIVPPADHFRRNHNISAIQSTAKTAVQQPLHGWTRSSCPSFQNYVAFLHDWVATIAIGVGVVSYWRGTWTLLDLYTCNQSVHATWGQGDILCGVAPPTVLGAGNDGGNTTVISDNNYNDDDMFTVVWSSTTTRVTSAWVAYLVGNILFVIGLQLLWTGWWVPRTDVAIVVTKAKAMQRIFIVYILGAATVSIWRGIWYLSDHWMLPSDPVTSWWITAGCGLAGTFLMTAGTSLLAPPAIFNMDGPGLYPPPLAVTILSSYYSLTLPASQDPPTDTSALVYTIDALMSFLVLPIFVVWFWRGCWSLLDQYLWGFTTQPQELHASLGYCTILAIALLFLGSDDIVRYFSCKSLLLNQVLCRIRTIVLAVGAVSFWRVVWIVWDEFCGGTTYWSAWLSHFGGVAMLIVLGSMSCILAPPATLGVDAVPHEDSADIPLFHNVPVPAEALFFFGIGRQPKLPSVRPSYRETEGRKSLSLLERQRPEFSSDPSYLRLSRQAIVESIGGSLTDRNIKKRQQSHFYRCR